MFSVARPTSPQYPGVAVMHTFDDGHLWRHLQPRKVNVVTSSTAYYSIVSGTAGIVMDVPRQEWQALSGGPAIEAGRRAPTPAELAAAELTPRERHYMIRSIVSSEALEGVVLAYEEVSSILDDVLQEPPVELG